MSLAVQPLEFRAAFPDEIGRAAYLDGPGWMAGPSQWFIALTDGPPERIVGAVRHAISADGDGTLQFRLTPGPGGELVGNEDEFLAAFLRSVRGPALRQICYADMLPEHHPLESVLEKAGFSTRYREQRFETGWDSTRVRIEKVLRAFEGKVSPMADAKIIPARECPVEMALPLVCGGGLLTERELRSIWNSPDPSRFDRDASACLVLGSEVLGVAICADGGTCLRVPAIAGREDIPGARRRAIPFLIAHILKIHADHGYEKFMFRANVETARQTVNLAQRMGGTVLQEVRRWVRKVD